MMGPREMRWGKVLNYGNVKEERKMKRQEEGRQKKEYLGSILKRQIIRLGDFPEWYPSVQSVPSLTEGML